MVNCLLEASPRICSHHVWDEEYEDLQTELSFKPTFDSSCELLFISVNLRVKVEVMQWSPTTVLPLILEMRSHFQTVGMDALVLAISTIQVVNAEPHDLPSLPEEI